MNRLSATFTAVAALLLGGASGLGTPAEAAGIERATPSVRLLFREGNRAEYSLTHVRPRLRGEDATFPPGVGPRFSGRTGNLFDSYSQHSFSLKGELGPRASYAVIIDEPFGADTDYGADSFEPVPPFNFQYDGTRARIRSRAISTVLAYDVTPNVKVYGGLRAQRTEADAALPFLSGYTIETDRDWALGWMAGAGYQIPAIALNVSLTYYSRVRHDFETLEFGAAETRTTVDTPQSVNLEFQSGVAAGTLVFGSVRWADWSNFVIAPPQYVAATGSALVEYPGDWWTYTLGVGRQLAPGWSGILQASWEPGIGGTLTTLGPVDGRSSVTAALTRTVGGAEVTGGVSFGWLGSTRNALDTRFEDGTFTAFALRVGTSF